ncbi:OmpA family protein [Granulosicoccus antarcticus]|uniref:Outer membrane porin F n=1 Tax=Granulosicoccus antarcticus IMCC3135 TaxID=1192854 RepID=A0A2Z2P0E1_9GAMM|nr:OmpA family protein [Granulosicoccus antarcticus]ASJ75558.1 Outer membrane porin F [Granulosicoccus antarcticus IMCC3135]
MSNSVSRHIACVVVLGISAFSASPLLAQQGKWYAGAGAGISRLTPDTDGSDFSLDKESSTAAGLYLGRDINDRLGIEIAYTDLGKAELSAGESIDYSALSLGGVLYVLGDTELAHRQDGWSGYVRFGLNKITNDSDVQLAEKDNTALWLGAGIQWPVGSSWGVRGELTSFDGDAQVAMASVYWRPGGLQSRTRNGSRATPAAVPRPAVVKPTVSKPEPELVPEPVPAAAPAAAPIQEAVVAGNNAPLSGPSVSSCAVPAAGEPLNSQGCALFSGVQQGVEFEGETTTLTAVGKTLLSRLAGSLNLYPELLVEIRVHTQTYTDPDRAQTLSRERAVAVARFLVAQGVAVKRLKARAFGSIQPRADNFTPGGRRLNNRVELRVL